MLLMVDAEGHRVIQEWLRRGQEGTGLPALKAIPGSVKLDIVPDLTLE